jgi:multiple sugar transport system substrate-binding protein
MQWLTSKEGDKAIALAGGSPSRLSTTQDPEVLAEFPHLEVFGEALADADPDWRPIIPAWGEINSELGTTLNMAMTGDMTVQEALDQVAARSREIMDEAGYYSWQSN